MDEAERERIRIELNRIWVQSIVKPYSKPNLRYWISKLSRGISQLRSNNDISMEDKALCRHMEISIHRLQRALGVLSRV